MNMEWLKSILTPGDDKLSSKRFCGVIGWMAVVVCYLYSSFTGKQLPEMGELLMACVALLGVDSVASVFKSKYNNNDKDEESN